MAVRWRKRERGRSKTFCDRRVAKELFLLAAFALDFGRKSYPWPRDSEKKILQRGLLNCQGLKRISFFYTEYTRFRV